MSSVLQLNGADIYLHVIFFFLQGVYWAAWGLSALYPPPGSSRQDMGWPWLGAAGGRAGGHFSRGACVVEQ